MKKYICLLLCIFLTNENFAALTHEQDTKEHVATTQKFDLIPKEKLVKTIADSLTILPVVIVDEISEYCLEDKWEMQEYIPTNKAASSIVIAKNVSPYSQQDETFAWAEFHKSTNENRAPKVKVNFYNIIKRQLLKQIVIILPCNHFTKAKLFYNNTHIAIEWCLYSKGCIWDIHKRKEVRTITETLFDSVALSPNNQSIAISHEKNITIISDIENKETRTSFISPHSDVDHLSYSADGKYLAAALNNGNIIIWDLITHKIFKTINLNIRNTPCRLTFSPDCKLLTWRHAGKRNQIQIWDIEQNREIITIPESYKASFFPDSRTMLVRDKNFLINIWNLTTKKMIHINQGGIPINDATISSCGKIIVALDTHNNLQKWQSASYYKTKTTKKTMREPSTIRKVPPRISSKTDTCTCIIL